MKVEINIKNLMLFLPLLILVLPFVSASDETSYLYEQNTTTDLKVSCFDANNSICDSGTACNITIIYPNSTQMVANQEMTYNPSYYNYSIDHTQLQPIGDYSVVMYCDGDYDGFSSFNFRVTLNGKEPPTDFTKVGFMIGFLVYLCAFIFTLFNFVGHAGKLDLVLYDLVYFYCMYFIGLAFKGFNYDYGGNAMVDRFLDLFIGIGAYTLILLPTMVYVVCMVINYLRFKKDNDRRRAEGVF